MQFPNQLTSVNSCCCFDLRTGGLILGYLELAFYVYALFAYPTLSYDFFFALSSLVLVVAWLYGIYENKCTYMRPNLIYSIIKTASICIGFVVHTITTVFALGLTDLIQEHTIPGKLAIIGDGMIQTKSDFPELEKKILDFKRSLAGMMFLHWFISAICTAISWYFIIVMISLYKQIKAESLGQQTAFMDQHLPDENFGLHSRVTKTDSLESIQITK